MNAISALFGSYAGLRRFLNKVRAVTEPDTECPVLGGDRIQRISGVLQELSESEAAGMSFAQYVKEKLSHQIDAPEPIRQHLIRTLLALLPKKEVIWTISSPEQVAKIERVTQLFYELPRIPESFKLILDAGEIPDDEEGIKAWLHLKVAKRLLEMAESLYPVGTGSIAFSRLGKINERSFDGMLRLLRPSGFGVEKWKMNLTPDERQTILNAFNGKDVSISIPSFGPEDWESMLKNMPDLSKSSDEDDSGAGGGNGHH